MCWSTIAWGLSSANTPFWQCRQGLGPLDKSSCKWWSAQCRTSIFTLACMHNMERNECLPFVWQEHPLVWGALCSVATFRAEEEPDEPFLRAAAHTEKLWMCCVWYEKDVRFFPYFLVGINIMELSPFISQTWWQLNSGVVAKMGMWKVQRELEFALQGEREGFFHTFEGEEQGFLWGLLLPEILIYLGLNWVCWGGHREQLGMKEKCSQMKQNTFFFSFERLSGLFTDRFKKFSQLWGMPLGTFPGQ